MPSFFSLRFDVLAMASFYRLPELSERALELFRVEKVLPDQRLPGKDREPVLEGPPVIPVDDAEGDAVAPLDGLCERSGSVRGIVLRPELVHPLSVPVVGVHLVEGHA